MNIDRLKYYHRRIKRKFSQKGLMATLGKMVSVGLYMPVRNRIGYYTKRKYNQNIIFIAGYPKSGSTWLTHLLSSLDGFDRFFPSKWRTLPSTHYEDISNDLHPGFFDEFSHNLAVIKGHTHGKPANVKILRESELKYLISVRDPRDKIISGYHYIRNHPDHWSHKIAMDMSLTEYITHKFESGEYEKENIDWLRIWLDNRDKENSMVVKYEDMLGNTFATMSAILIFLGIPFKENNLLEIVDKNSFARKAGRKQGQENTKSFLRKGTAGEWKDVFTPEQKILFADFGEDAIERLGYEPTLATNSDEQL